MRKLLVTAVAVAALALPGSVGALATPGVVHALGTATAFSLTSGGVSWSGGLASWSYACASCHVRFTVQAPDMFLVAQDGTLFLELPPGSYVVSGFAGYASYTFQAPHRVFVELHGAGRVFGV